MNTVAFYDAKPYDREYFRKAPGFERLEVRFHDFRLTQDTAALAAGARAVCVFVNDRLDAGCLRALHQGGVRLVALRCAGFNNVDLAAARELGIAVTRVPAYSPYAVAEHTVALLLALVRNIPRAHNRVREHNFSLNGLTGFDLHGKTAGIVGTGKIGRIAARILQGFGMEMLACDPFPSPEWAAAEGVNYVPLDSLLERSDVVSLHLPLNPESLFMMNGDAFARMKPGACLVNTSRGRLVDTAALISALKSGKLGGVALDVYEEEESLFFEDHSGEVLQDEELMRLLTFPNVLITAHQAFLTREALTEIARVTAENLTRFAAGQPFLDGSVLNAPPQPETGA
ncbi:MAG: 2-hydroxyacid dehydrogenase [Verrucomicrobiaceae bacterium]|nr:MAG: 2-hydroxyacid dehydrogenase [Verrucomicrobiaceae bacterium]